LSQLHKAANGPVHRGANIYFAASGIAQASGLLRYVALARLLGPEQLGLAAMLVLTAAFFDLISDTGSDRFLIQDRDGDTPDVQKLVHLVYIGRGVVTALGLAVFAWPVAIAFKAPQLAGGLALLGLTRLILGFLHLDLRRTQRILDFRNEATCLIASELAALVATVVAAFLTRNFTAILYGLAVRSIVMVAVSHLQAQRPYRVGFSREHAGRLSRFAGPLMLNGVLLFFATQGDRALIGHQMGFVALGRYSAIILLISFPMALLTRYTQAMYLPLLARVRDQPTERARVANVMGGQVLIIALAVAAAFALVTPTAVKLLYGARFSESALVIGLIGILQAGRFLQVYPTVVALSVGRSSGPLAMNTTRLTAYPAALLGALLSGGLEGIIIGFAIGEVLAQCVGLLLLNKDFERPIFTGFGRILMFVIVSAMILGWTWAAARGSPATVAVALLASSALAAWVLHRERAAITESLALLRRLTQGLTAKLAKA
jgi:lipopolysaccharide exporter